MVDRPISGVLAAALTPLGDDLAPDREVRSRARRVQYS